MMIVPAMAANETYQLLRPGMGQEWLNNAGVDVQTTLSWILGALIVAVALVFVGGSIVAYLHIATNSGNMGDSGGKSKGEEKLIKVLLGLAVLVLFVKLGLSFFGWF